MDKISVIVPVYQTQKYIRKCLESILNQSYGNLEIILIDDGSTDTGGNICDEFAKNDLRIIVVHQRNAGLSVARNKGIELASGNYIAFVDSDDYIDNNFIEELYSSMWQNNAEISVCNIVQENEISGNEKLLIFKQLNHVFNNHEAMKYLLRYENGFGGYACNKLFHIKLFKNIRFPADRIFEDTFTVYKLFAQAQKVSYTEKTLYHYIIRENSITSNFNPDKKMDFIYANKDRFEYIKKEYPALNSFAFNTYLISVISTLNEQIKHNQFNDKIDVFLDEAYYNLNKNKKIAEEVSFIYRVSMIFAKKQLGLYKKIMTLYYKGKKAILLFEISVR